MSTVARAVIFSSLVIGLTLTAAETVHATQADRTKQCLTKGDADTSQRISRNVVKAAIEKWKIADLVSDQAIKTAEKELYNFLKLKLGSPAAICAQYVTADTQHFIKGYSDEAAYALLGEQLPGDGRPKWRLPKKISDELKAQIKSCADQVVAAVAGKAPASPAPTSQTTPPSTLVTDKLTAQAMEKVSTACQQQVAKLRQQLEKDYNIPPEARDAAIKEISKAAVAGVKAVDRIAFDVPKPRGKGYDIDNSVVLKLIADRRAEKGTR